ncbi:hypothetical protein GLU26_00025 [Nanohaloarchaea archaeon]|nr:hypothetical protein [Candidatus Nanohaloarchaea archaeon]
MKLFYDMSEVVFEPETFLKNLLQETYSQEDVLIFDKGITGVSARQINADEVGNMRPYPQKVL